MKKSVGPVRMSRNSDESRAKSHIPLPKGRSSSNDRDSRSRMRTVSLSNKKKRSRSHALTPTTPVIPFLDVPFGFGSATLSTRSRSGSRCGSAERGFKPHKGKLIDTRPIKDPGFQHRAMVRIYQYFQRQPQEIRSLCPLPNTRSIMIQSFVDIMGYLLRHFFNNHGVYKKNYLEEIPKLMKLLYYPGTVSSSWLKTVNAPHAWPHVVAMMSWLVDVIVEREKITIDDFFPVSDEDGPPETSKITFKSILMGFEAWDKFEEDRVLEIDLALEDSLKRNQGFSDDDIQKLIKENAELMELMNDPIEQKAINVYEALVESVKALALEEEAISRSIQAKEKSIEDANEKYIYYQNKKQHLDQELESKKIKLDHLAQVVATQAMSKDGAKVIKEEISSLEQEIKNHNSYLTELQKVKCGDDMKMASIKNKLNNMCVDFNKEILHTNFPELQKFIIQTNLNFFARDLVNANSEMNNIDIGLNELKIDLSEKIKLADGYVEKLDQDLKELTMEKKKNNDKMKALEEETLLKRRESEALDLENETNQKHFKAEYDALKAKTNELVKVVPNLNDKVAGLTAELKESRARETGNQQKLDEVVKIGVEFLRAESLALADYKANVMKMAHENLGP